MFSISGILNYYQPGTTLFSIITQHGQVGDLSRQLPPPVDHQGSGTVPVIILRVLPTQLASNHLYPNLPQTNNFATVLNSLDIKSLLANYLSKMNTSPVYSDPKYQPEVQYPEPQYQSEEQYYGQPSQSYQHQTQYNAQSGYDNYQSQIQQTPVYQSQSYEPTLTKSSFDIVKSLEPQPSNYNLQNQYPGQQYLRGKPQSQGLLTHENYPSKSHTRVIFKTPEGKLHFIFSRYFF